jgi:O-antigen/teichoic acid export membrane protein
MKLDIARGSQVELLRRTSNTPAFGNALNSIVRFGARSAWALLLPVWLSVQDYSKFSLFVTSAQVFLYLSILGSTSAVMREKVTRVELLFSYLHSIALLSILYVIARLASVTLAESAIVRLLYAYVGFSIAYTLLVAFWKSRLQFFRLLFVEFTVAVLFGALVALVVWRKIIPVTFETAVGGEVVWTSLLVLVLFLLLARERKDEPFEPRTFFRKLASVYSIGALVLVDIVIWRRIEIFFLALSPDAISGPAVVNMTLQYALVMTMIPGAILEAWYPRLADSFVKDSNHRFAESLRPKLAKYSAVYLMAAFGGLVLFIAYFGYFLQKYHEWTVPVLLFLGIRILFGWSAFFSNVVYAARRERVLFGPIAVAAVCSVVLHWRLTVSMGLTGCLIAFSITQLFVLIGTLWVFNSVVPLKDLLLGLRRTRLSDLL